MHFRPYMSTVQEYLECPVTDSVTAITTTINMYCKYAYIQSRNEERSSNWSLSPAVLSHGAARPGKDKEKTPDLYTKSIYSQQNYSRCEHHPS